ncbi:nuak family snf1-like kinase 1 [Plakobranchus ocellatus]|uniref:Nuak family snf1-like kinase 1 n=1 Tax=Plakobranchus ocellatus TaxID=259542 RepID=A0AAV3Z905_9GAST|nr:nuak family snf1-like kinase 1 [Plakobranchus ocellatus]
MDKGIYLFFFSDPPSFAVFEKKDKIVLVMDYAQGGELYDYLNNMGRLSEWEARRIFRQIVSAIHCCHQNGIVHRDLKLENIILDDVGNVKIADFGMANYYSHTSKLETFCGSPLYASPEIVNGRSYYGPEVDVWSLGVILYTLVYGSMPFESNSLVSLKQQISEGDYRQPSKPSGIDDTVASESALRSAGTLLSRVRAPPPAPRPEGGPENLSFVVDWPYIQKPDHIYFYSQRK